MRKVAPIKLQGFVLDLLFVKSKKDKLIKASLDNTLNLNKLSYFTYENKDYNYSKKGIQNWIKIRNYERI